MLKARDIMSKTLLTICLEASLKDAIELLVANGISGLPVIDDENKLVGIITEKDIINFAFSGNLNNTRVSEAMSREVTSFSADTDIHAIALAISQHNIRRVPIVESGKVVGIISRRDIIRAALNLQK